MIYTERADAVDALVKIRARHSDRSEFVLRQVAESDVRAAEDNEGVYQDDVVYVCWGRGNEYSVCAVQPAPIKNHTDFTSEV